MQLKSFSHQLVSVFQSSTEKENPSMEPKESKPIVEQREETMVCLTGGKPTLRTARFLHPFVTSVDKAMAIPLVPPLISQIISTKSAETWPLKVQFKGWREQQPKWKQWVEKLVLVHEPIWRKTCIYDAIMASTYKVRKDENLVFGLVELWSPETNTFVFPWGEATITLEDVLILGGFSVLGEPVTSPLNDNLLQINERLGKERKGFSKHKSTKPTCGAWITHFMEKKDIDGNLEHVAFLALWLSRYVFPTHPQNLVGKHVFPIAIHLAQGTRLALAPAVLSSLYGDLRLLNQNVIASNDSCDVWALFHILELWAWEHLPLLRPKPLINLLGKDEPRVARWHGLSTSLELQFVRSVLESPENFHWRCYATSVFNWRHPSFYNEKEMWVLYDFSMDDELRSFAHCLRASELVGLNCIEQYLPHRVAMQFGLDQDLPGYFTRANSRWKKAWKTYYNAIEKAVFYIPPRLAESDVTTRYLEWWKSMRNHKKETADPLLHQKRRGMGYKGLKNEEKEESHDSGPPGFPPRNKKHKLQEVKLDNWSDDYIDTLPISQSLKLLRNRTEVINLPVTEDKPFSSSTRCRTSQPSTIVSNTETKRRSSTVGVEINASTKPDRTGDSTQDDLGIGKATFTSRTDQDTELENRVLKLEKESHDSGPPGFPPRNKKHKLQEVKLENWSDDYIDTLISQSLKLLRNKTEVINLPVTEDKPFSSSTQCRTAQPSTIVGNTETKRRSSTVGVEINASTKPDRTGDSTQDDLGTGKATFTSRTDKDTELENRVLKLEKVFAGLKARLMAKQVEMKRRTPR